MKLKQLLSEAGKSQKWLAEETGITPTAISNYVLGYRKPQGPTLLKIAKALDVTPAEIIGSEEVQIAGQPASEIIAAMLDRERRQAMREFATRLKAGTSNEKVKQYIDRCLKEIQCS